MINLHTLSHAIAEEVRSQEAENYALWRSIPASSPAKAVTLLENECPVHAKYRALHRAGVAEFSAALRRLDDQTQPQPRVPALMDWLQARSNPWLFGASGHEWQFLGFPDRQTLARDLVRLRGANGNVTPHAQKLLDYYITAASPRAPKHAPLSSITSRRFIIARGSTRVSVTSVPSRSSPN